jgi:transcriptional regulator with XRE-family HTH domain
MGRNRLHSPSMQRAYRGGNSSMDPYWCDWAAVVGDRVRRLRQARNMRLIDLAIAVWKPEGGHYNPGYFSRLERGWASAPLYVYLAVADALGVDAGVLLGPDAASLEVNDAEATLLGCLRSLGIAPHEAIAALMKRLDPGNADQQLTALDHGGLASGGPGPVVYE